jgi:hypothetical protein
MHAPAGLIAILPLAETPEGERSHSAWLLTHEAFLRFDHYPDTVFSEKTDEYGFRGRGRAEIPGVNLLDLRAQVCTRNSNTLF